MNDHLTYRELEAGLDQVRSSPRDDGVLQMIVVRTERGLRRTPESCMISAAAGLEGDHWSRTCKMRTEDGLAHPDMQICMMNARTIELIAQDRDRWAIAGDNLFIDLDISHENLAPRQTLGIGEALIEITAVPHNGCAKFIDRFGKDACQFVNSRTGKELRLRGIYARVVQDGRIAVGDRIGKKAIASAA